MSLLDIQVTGEGLGEHLAERYLHYAQDPASKAFSTDFTPGTGEDELKTDQRLALDAFRNRLFLPRNQDSAISAVRTDGQVTLYSSVVIENMRLARVSYMARDWGHPENVPEGVLLAERKRQSALVIQGLLNLFAGA